MYLAETKRLSLSIKIFLTILAAYHRYLQNGFTDHSSVFGKVVHNLPNIRASSLCPVSFSPGHCAQSTKTVNNLGNMLLQLQHSIEQCSTTLTIGSLTALIGDTVIPNSSQKTLGRSWFYLQIPHTTLVLVRFLNVFPLVITRRSNYSGQSLLMLEWGYLAAHRERNRLPQRKTAR